MKNSPRTSLTLYTAPLVLAVLLLVGGPAVPKTEVPNAADAAIYIVQGQDLESVTQAVAQVGGSVARELSIINGVAAKLTADQFSSLQASIPELSVWTDRTLEVAKKPPKDDGGGGDPFGSASATVTRTVGADLLHDQGITGAGVTVAVVDTGYWGHNTLRYDTADRDRVLAVYNAITDEYESLRRSCDDSGHGTHVLSLIAATNQDELGDHLAIAPDVDLVAIKAFGADGSGTYADVIYGLQWILDHREVYGIRVVNLSFSAEPRSFYFDDPLNQAVMGLWQAGIVVVASAGNRGPDAMTIGVPGNVPYVITVGATGDHQIPVSDSNDFVAVFSSAGPTFEGFVKPELIAPGGKVPGIMNFLDQIALEHPDFAFNKRWFLMSGTSQSTAVVTGIVALMLQESPWLTPNEVKYRLMESARPATFQGGSLVYSVFQQGAGLANAPDAVFSDATATANRGLDIDLDLAGVAHYRGAADAYEQNGNQGPYFFFIRDANGNPVEEDGFMWSDKYVYEDGFMWSDGFMYFDGFMWSDSLLEPASINVWIDQQ